jgi:hypothetical protein
VDRLAESFGVALAEQVTEFWDTGWLVPVGIPIVGADCRRRLKIEPLAAGLPHRGQNSRAADTDKIVAAATGINSPSITSEDERAPTPKAHRSPVGPTLGHGASGRPHTAMAARALATMNCGCLRMGVARHQHRGSAGAKSHGRVPDTKSTRCLSRVGLIRAQVMLQVEDVPELGGQSRSIHRRSVA